MSWFGDSPLWRWSWEEMCGPDGLKIWSTKYKDLGICFQYLCLQIPVLALIAVISAYYSGRHFGYVVRGKLQKNCIKIRSLIALTVATIPVVQNYVDYTKTGQPLVPIKLFLAVTQFIAWIIHFVYLLTLKKRLGMSPRGPVKLCVLWTLYVVLTVISLHSYQLILNSTEHTLSEVIIFKFSIALIIFQAVYALTLIPSEGRTESLTYNSRYVQIGETQPLLGSSNSHTGYNRFLEEQDPHYLGSAMEESTFLSCLLFYWVNPLIKKGTEKKLNHPDDLYDLPDDLNCGTVSLKLQKALIGNIDKSIQQSLTSMRSQSSVENSPEISFSNVKIPRVSLLVALHKCFWFQFYTIGILRFISDCSGFAGPLLLNKLVGFIENKGEDLSLGYLYTFGLFITTLIGALCNAHFNFYMNIVGLKIRAALVSTIYRKTLTVEGTVLNNEFNVGEIMNFMSTDTDRIVNSCPSFHAVWSIPFQLSVTLYLLYKQVGLAFLAGVGFSIILIPINKLIANKIGDLSTKLMSQKDERVRLITEVLRGIRTIKLYVWERHFIRLITKQRSAELKYLKGRKYLDALCVYFWATTPVLISILTFGTYVLTGNKLTAATIFTSMALLNMLIAPLNAFPWVLNGLTEAWVSIKRVQRLLNLPDLDQDKYYDTSILDENSKYHIYIKNGRFDWGQNEDHEHGDDLNGHDVEGTNKKRRGVVQTNIKGRGVVQTNIKGRGVVQTNIKGRSTETDSLDGSGTEEDLIEGRGSEGTAVEPTVNSPTNENRSIRVKVKDKKGKKKMNIGDGSSNEIRHFVLADINLYVQKGQFIGVMGQVGSGKSSLLNCILAELTRKEGIISINDLELGFGFVTQQPWLQRGTLRDNILFGKAFDDNKYKTVLSACGLAEDVYLLPAGDLTGVGEGGVTLSGGQKARVALARAVYQDKSIYILDDIISAVDRHVAKHIFQHCILGLLSNKTRILCTHHTQYLVHCDWLVVMENGRMVKQGKPSEVLEDEEFLLPNDFENSGHTDNSLEITEESVIKETESEMKENTSLLNQESSETGTVQFDVYSSYWKAIGHLLSICILMSMVLMQTSRNMTDWWLSYWVSMSEPPNGTTNATSENITILWESNDLDAVRTISYYMTIYGLFVGMNTIFTLFRAFLFAYGGIAAATKIHRSLLKVILKSKVTFFDISPLGRILNRFSSDTYTIDDSLPFILNILLAQTFGVIGSVIVTIYGLPWLCLILIPLMPIYHWLQFNYRLTSRELKRLSSVTLSPIYSHFNETLQGLSTIRAFRATQRFKRDNEDNVEANQKAQFASSAASQWLGIRLQLIGVAMVTGVGLIAVIQHQYDVANPGLVGLAISYALSITGLLSGVVNAFTETEREMIAVERVNQYIEQVEPEKNNVVVDPPYAWPFQGVISFNNVVMKYRDHLAPSLKGITFETRPAEKIGVVGRTGAGKSSLLYALFRLVNLHSGTILIDAVNIAHISLDCLRSRLAVIPQDPFLFTGTVRANLDPLEEYRTPELWTVLTRVNLAPLIRQSGGLDTKIGAGGLTFSVGQKQLICLARAILHNAKIICIDEATANVDQETDRQIQQILRSAFSKSTMITIAHRIHTVIDYDRVLVMGDGQVLEFDNPNTLLDDPDSNFYKLVNQNT